jgi:glucosamine--fructose-6-phosphate aminotransferase (isomerizing)
VCGIVGYVGHRQAWPIVFEGLQRLEYRGYDSAGIGVLDDQGRLTLHKSVGKVRELENYSGRKKPIGTLGIGHTRWATHGVPSDANAHPHTDCDHQITLVHNGIVENYLELKRDLMSRGHWFESDTDSEVIAHLIEESLALGESFESSLLHTASLLRGASAIGVALNREPWKLLALRLGHAGGLVVSQGEGEAMLASDLPALVPIAKEVCFLESGELAILTQDRMDVIDSKRKPVNKLALPVRREAAWVDKAGYDHFMLKEIMEQPQAVSSVLRERVDFESGIVSMEHFPLSDAEVKGLNRVVLIAAGTSLYASMVGKYFIENMSGIPAEVDSSSEFRYGNRPIDSRTLVISVSQSGETADTLAAMKEAGDRGGRLVNICNAEGSQATRIAEATFLMRSGLEVGVASTKTFVASLVILLMLATHLGRVRGALSSSSSSKIVNGLAKLPRLMGRVLTGYQAYKGLAQKYSSFDHFLYLGRGQSYPIALEGALKLKEISYIHAEGYPAGEMKHGPIALVDKRMPVLAVVTRGLLYEKMMSNIQEVKARGGVVIGLGTNGDKALASQVDDVIYIPSCSEFLTPMLAVLPLQLLAYHIAVDRGCDVDQPRNLAKSVTVE